MKTAHDFSTSNNNHYHSLIHSIKIPGLEIAGNIFLAPIAGYTNAAFRFLCIENGAYFAFTEMVSAEACARKHEKTFKLLDKAPNEDHFAIQIFAGNPKAAAAAVKELIPYKPALIDLNCGCSVPKIMKAGAGAILLKEPDKIKTLVQVMKNETTIPISIKIRSGWDFNSINFLEITEKALAAGVDLITLHPRTRSQLFGGKANREHLKTLKAHFPQIPVIGSGDLFTAGDVRDMLLETGCDGVMIARGAIGNPFIFRQVKALLLNPGPDTDPAALPPLLAFTEAELLTTALKHLRLEIADKGENRACIEMRKLFCAYTKGFAHSAPLRQQLVYAASYTDYEKLIIAFMNRESNGE